MHILKLHEVVEEVMGWLGTLIGMYLPMQLMHPIRVFNIYLQGSCLGAATYICNSCLHECIRAALEVIEGMVKKICPDLACLGLHGHFC